jgi:hypothetical protein
MMLMRPARMPARHYAENGLVSCPARGRDVDIESCLCCRALRAMTADRTCVLCEGQPPEPAENAARQRAATVD